MNPKSSIAALIMVTTLLPTLFLTSGCRPPDTEADAKQVEMTNRLDEIAKRSGGDWNKLTDDERKYLVQDISMGNEKSAQMLLMGKAGKLQGRPRAPR